MSDYQKIMNASFLREVNTRIVMRCVRNYGPLSRSEICKITKLSKPTVTRVINALFQDEMLIETTYTETERGRYPVNIDLNADAVYCFGVNISKNSLRIALVDLKLNVIDTARYSIKEIDSSKTFLNLVDESINQMKENNKILDNKVLGIGVGAPGLVDSERGVIKDFALWGKFRDIMIVDYLEEHTSFKTRVGNNCNTWLAGEMWTGCAQEYKDVLIVLNSEGVGCGIAQDGIINHNINNISAGLGHVSINFKGDRCNCGSRGCIETYCTTENIERKAQEKLDSIRRANPDFGFSKTIDYKEVCASIENGNMFFSDIILDAASALACGLVNIINVLYPQIIVLAGTMFDESDFYYKNILIELDNRLSTGVKAPPIVRRKMSDAILEVGAATMVLQELF